MPFWVTLGISSVASLVPQGPFFPLYVVLGMIAVSVSLLTAFKAFCGR